MKQWMKRLAGLTLAIMLLASIALAEPMQLTGRFTSPGFKVLRSWRFPFDDALFEKPASQYDHTLARASLGMAVTAFRDTHKELGHQQDNIVDYLTQAGFTKLSSGGYDEKPGAHTIATLIGQKPMAGFTLIAVAVCGGGYGDEWIGNFTIGDEERHVGFQLAALQVEERVHDYAATVDGPKRMWISGFSRAAAVTNLTAADLTVDGTFDEVFAYAFATPLNTKTPVVLPNIFNIVGKFDAVPNVPIGEWGFGRNGVDLYTPAQQTDSDYRQKSAAADLVYEKLTGLHFWNNPEVDQSLRTLLSFLYDVLPAVTDYVAHMQSALIGMWKDVSIGNLTTTMTAVFDDMNLLDDDRRLEGQELLDYLSSLVYGTVTGGSGLTQGWNGGAPAGENLVHEHTPEVYIAWLFSQDTPDALYSQSTSYSRLIWSGGATARVYDSKARYVCTISEGGTLRTDEPQPDGEALPIDTPQADGAALPADARPALSFCRKGTQNILTLPRDDDYIVLLTAERDGQLVYCGTRLDARKLDGAEMELSVIEMTEGELFLIIDDDSDNGEHVLGSGDFELDPWSDKIPYSPALLVALENNNVFHLTWTEMAWVIGGTLVLLLALLVLTTALLLRRRKRKHRAKAAQAIAASADAPSIDTPSIDGTPSSRAPSTDAAPSTADTQALDDSPSFEAPSAADAPSTADAQAPTDASSSADAQA